MALLGLGEHPQKQMGYQQINWDSQMKIFLLVHICHPQSQHQGPKGVGHVPPGSHRELLQGQIRYQQIWWDSQTKNFLLVDSYLPLTTPGHLGGLGSTSRGKWGLLGSQMKNFPEWSARSARDDLRYILGMIWTICPRWTAWQFTGNDLNNL